MNTTNTRHIAATVATTTAVAAALTIVSASAPTVASAHQAAPLPGPATSCVGSDGSAGTLDIPLEIAHRKSLWSQYYIDHALELYQRDAR